MLDLVERAEAALKPAALLRMIASQIIGSARAGYSAARFSALAIRLSKLASFCASGAW